MLSFHVKRLLRGCQETFEATNNPTNIEIVCKNGKTYVNPLVFASLSRPWIRKCLTRSTSEETQIIFPIVDVNELTLFFNFLFTIDFNSKYSDDLQCAISNLTPYFEMKELIMSNDPADLNDPEPFFESFETNDMDEDIIRDNCTDQDGRLVCLICYKIFKKDYFEMFKTHMNTHPLKLRKKKQKVSPMPNYTIKSKKCKLCSFSCENVNQFNAHLKIHIQKKYSCLTCNRAFQSEKLLENHTSSGSCQELKKQCHICQKFFSDSTRLKIHLNTHIGLKPWTCQICDKSFSELRTLKEHKLTHTPNRSFKCEICSKRFVQKNHLLYHLASKHGQGEKLHKCNECQKSFAFPFQLKKHQTVHAKK